MKSLYKTSVAYKTELIDAGFTQEKIDGLNTLTDELINADYNQEMFKKKRPMQTRERVILLNECYEIMRNVSRVGKNLFSENYTKYQQYLLPGEPESNDEPGDENQEPET